MSNIHIFLYINQAAFGVVVIGQKVLRKYDVIFFLEFRICLCFCEVSDT